MVLERIAPEALEGEAELFFQSDGLTYRLAVPIPAWPMRLDEPILDRKSDPMRWQENYLGLCRTFAAQIGDRTPLRHRQSARWTNVRLGRSLIDLLRTITAARTRPSNLVVSMQMPIFSMISRRE